MQQEKQMRWVFNDGGRSTAGFEGKSGDCGCRAIAIATDTPYQEVYDLINETASIERVGCRKRGKSNARTGVYVACMHRVLDKLGWEWVATMHVGSGCKVHLTESELPKGRLIVRVSKHFAAVIDGIVHDRYDPSRNGTRCVYGYWRKKV
jgi:hypothetical protein